MWLQWIHLDKLVSSLPFKVSWWATLISLFPCNLIYSQDLGIRTQTPLRGHDSVYHRAQERWGRKPYYLPLDHEWPGLSLCLCEEFILGLCSGPSAVFPDVQNEAQFFPQASYSQGSPATKHVLNIIGITTNSLFELVLSECTWMYSTCRQLLHLGKNYFEQSSKYSQIQISLYKNYISYFFLSHVFKQLSNQYIG